MLLALSLLATLGVIAAGCGATKKTVLTITDSAPSPPATTVTGTRTIPNAATGTLIVCKSGPSALVPPDGKEVSGTADGRGKSAGTVQLAHAHDGSVRVVCRG